MIYRRFGYLQARLLLEKQSELRRLERALEILDIEDKCDKKISCQRDLKTISRTGDRAVKRLELMEEIERKFREFGV
jgi:hypothetical protein